MRRKFIATGAVFVIMVVMAPGVYSVYDGDASTLAMISAYAEEIAA